MQPHEQRVVDERNELNRKLEKLEAFLKSDLTKKIDENQLILLFRQFRIMSDYSSVLAQRIELFEE